MTNAGAEHNAAQRLHVQTPVKHSAVYITADIEGTDVTYLVDTVSSLPIMSWDVYKVPFPTDKSLRIPELKLLDYSGK